MSEVLKLKEESQEWKFVCLSGNDGKNSKERGEEGGIYTADSKEAEKRDSNSPLTIVQGVYGSGSLLLLPRGLEKEIDLF